MDEKTFQRKLDEAKEKIRILPKEQQDKLNETVHETVQRHQAIKKAVKGIEDSLATLRVGIQYLAFDLEATKRENEELRKQVNGGFE